VRSTGLGVWAWNPPACFPIIVLLCLVTVAHGGWALLGSHRVRHGGRLPRAVLRRWPHAHAGVLLVMSLAYLDYLGRAGYSAGRHD
jgi:hypothetical protein